ncbi:HD domain-containing phosphohydrolase [Desulfuromonas sp. AOP6]|uniref:HD-GYP domain-containing protein n=1 Tax=Desulfuromonas sp. AOP6 TaxID=1566351 RepID=UPI0012821087|nr:HD domain-containing phosphohydrolase [Desulfuromonas sp. AOP6]BCA79540.1 two-component system response regulator [Desulfuromonas sp. AOP6]
MIPAILVLDHEAKITEALSPLFAEEDIRLHRAESLKQALEVVHQEMVVTIVLGDVIPPLEIPSVLMRLKSVAPYAVKILLVHSNELANSVPALNSGEVFRLIVRPWDAETLRQTIKDALYRHEVVLALKEADEATLRSLGQAIELKDHYTKGHCDRVAGFALLIGKALHLASAQLTDIRHGSWLHDCGKIGVPENILNFQGELDHPDFEVLKLHPTWGAEVARQANLQPGVINAILHHHERYDGLGYPAGLKGDDIPLEARIVTVADVYDAITTRRPYREQVYSLHEAKGIISSMAGTYLDPDLVRIFLGRINEQSTDAPAEKAATVLHQWTH